MNAVIYHFVFKSLNVIEILIVIVIVIVINFYDAMYHEIEIIFIWSKFLNVL